MNANRSPTYDLCSRCDTYARGQTVSFGVGWKSRGRSPRTLVTDLRVLTADRIFVCEACERQLFWVGMRRQFLAHIELIAAPALLLASALWFGLASEERQIELLTGIAGSIAFLGWLVFRWRSRRAEVLRELLFESRRDESARRLERPAKSLAVYPPPKRLSPDGLARVG